jgi:hypothetical protein
VGSEALCNPCELKLARCPCDVSDCSDPCLKSLFWFSVSDMVLAGCADADDGGGCQQDIILAAGSTVSLQVSVSQCAVSESESGATCQCHAG